MRTKAKQGAMIPQEAQVGRIAESRLKQKEGYGLHVPPSFTVTCFSDYPRIVKSRTSFLRPACSTTSQPRQQNRLLRYLWRRGYGIAPSESSRTFALHITPSIFTSPPSEDVKSLVATPSFPTNDSAPVTGFLVSAHSTDQRYQRAIPETMITRTATANHSRASVPKSSGTIKVEIVTTFN